MRITSAGNVGIGTNSPTATLNVNGPSQFAGSGAAFPSTGTGIEIVGAPSGSPNYIQAYNRTASTWQDLVINGNVVAFGTAGFERMRIDSSGNLMVGKTSAVDTVVGGHILDNGRIVSTMASSTGSDSTLHVYSTGAAEYRFYVTMGGTIFATNTTISAISDQRLKENVQDLDVGLDAVMALKPRKFDWKEGKGKNVKGDRGWIAQEFEQVFPDMVDEWKAPSPEGEEPYKSVRADLIPVLVKAIQEQQQIINSLKTRIEALEGTQP
jgi:hypothetical protein